MTTRASLIARPPARGFLGKTVFLFLLIGLAAVGYRYRDRAKEIYQQKFRGEGKQPQIGATYQATKGEMVISVRESGTVQAVKSIKIASQVEGQTRIISIVPEGIRVKEGQLLVELDSSDIEDRINQQEINLETAKASLTEAEESLAIQENQNLSDISNAKLRVEFSQTDLLKYREGDWPQKLRTAESDITIAQEELNRAEDQLKWTAKLEKEGFVTRSELLADELSVKKRQLAVDKAKETLRILKQYEYPKTLKELQAAVEDAKMELVRVNHKAKAEILKKQAVLSAKQATYNLQNKKLEKLREQLVKCKIYAPSPGLVVYYSERSRWGRSESIIEEGTLVRERQKLISLPDISMMRVDVKVHETAVDKVRPGQQALLTVDALPGKKFIGHVKSVASVPDSQVSWLNPDLKVYNTEVLIDSGASEMKPGMSAKVEIVAAKLEDVLYVPVQAITQYKKRECCFVSSRGRIEMRAVIPGVSNDKHVVIKQGLEPGERVLLYEPDLSDQIARVGFNKLPPKPEVSAASLPAAKKSPATARAGARQRSRSAQAHGNWQKGQKRSGGNYSALQKRFSKMSEAEKSKFRKRMQNASPEERKRILAELKNKGS